MLAAKIRKKGKMSTFANSFNMFCEMTLQEAIEAKSNVTSNLFTFVKHIRPRDFRVTESNPAGVQAKRLSKQHKMLTIVASESVTTNRKDISNNTSAKRVKLFAIHITIPYRV